MGSLIHGDCLAKLKTIKSNSIDSIVTDPPYGLSFMGKKWDYDVPSVEIWKEALRVLKPGGHLLSFGGTRTYHRMVVNIEDAGFEIRDCIQWLYGSGFPKSHNLKDEFKGWGTALKPANEPICVARKPLEKGLTVAENVIKWGCGAINIDGSRIGTEQIKTQGGDKFKGKVFGKYATCEESTHEGRWPANIILDEDAAAALDLQSGTLKSCALKAGHRQHGSGEKDGDKYSYRADGIIQKDYGNDSGGASRFFYVAKASKSERNAGLEGMPTKEKKTLGDYANPSEGRTASKSGSEMQNFHPTVKPIKLMQYLINLVTPPNGTVLDPFMGSGTTGVAAINLERDFIGIELSQEYFEIAKNRIEQKKEIERQMELAYG